MSERTITIDVSDGEAIHGDLTVAEGARGVVLFAMAAAAAGTARATAASRVNSKAAAWPRCWPTCSPRPRRV